ncbi:DUF6328 family protein [Euzebya rosea]|uniref:DUF6328 family protein n=1 Tax=Euzebya rosea TaxID=2052804 RepID=UPI0013008623|nr:DUF6328 family protein [Euzebya rosea]
MSDGTPRTADEVGTDGSVEEQFRSLMEGLRTTLPGVEVLVAFLLTLPFQSGFTDLDQYQRGAYLVSLVAAASSAVLLIAPSAHQRVRSVERGGRVARKHEQHLRTAVHVALAGTVLASVAIVAAMYLATSMVVSRGVAITLAVVLGLLASWTWFGIPVFTFDSDSD